MKMLDSRPVQGFAVYLSESCQRHTRLLKFKSEIMSAVARKIALDLVDREREFGRR